MPRESNRSVLIERGGKFTSEQRKKIREAYRYQCQGCGRVVADERPPDKPEQEALEIHHVKRRRHKGRLHGTNDLNNGVPLHGVQGSSDARKSTCHGRADKLNDLGIDFREAQRILGKFPFSDDNLAPRKDPSPAARILRRLIA